MPIPNSLKYLHYSPLANPFPPNASRHQKFCHVIKYHYIIGPLVAKGRALYI